MSAPFYCSSNKGEYVLTIRKLALVAIPAVLAAVGTSSIRVAAQVSGPAAAGPVVVTKDGPVRGLFTNGVNAYLGIPYAAPPVGDLRWSPPAPPAHHGLIDATRFANTCPQVTELGAFAGPSSTTEDCLYLNVFTTGKGGPPKSVLVWIHGGGNVDGEINDYDGSKLAKSGPLGTPTVVIRSTIAWACLASCRNPI
jgi:para-nitrobenzyl esterase